MNKKKVIFDIDGTLANCDHRLHHIQGQEKDWDSFYGACGDDPLIEPIADLFDMCLCSGYEPVLVTGRSEKYRRHTLDWFRHHGLMIPETPLDLRMRAEGDYRPDYVVKAELVSDEELPDVLFVVEDRAQAVKMWRERGLMQVVKTWRERGLMVPQCAEGDY